MLRVSPEVPYRIEMDDDSIPFPDSIIAHMFPNGARGDKWAARIVLAVNAHDALVGACQALLDAQDRAATPQHYAVLVDDVCELARAALALATDH